MMTAAVAALAVAAPASAQRWNGRQAQSGELATQIDAGVSTGTISQREMTPLRNSLRQLIRLERAFATNGISSREHASLQQHGANLRRQIDLAGQSGFGRNRPDGRDLREDRFGSKLRFDGPNRGDRFAGDARIGGRMSARMVALPEQYRGESRDDADVYYRYDDGRIYQVDRRTNLILGLSDMDWTDRDGRRDSSSRSRWFDGPNRGDRFAGDARVGQRMSARMIAVPEQYRGAYRDDGDVYYRYDDGRIYQVDRRTNLISGLLDLLN
jgi:hypothetical protein